jgi:hypothetical protein
VLYNDMGNKPDCSNLPAANKTIKLVDSECNPLPNVRVNLRRSNGGYITNARTDANGVADFSGYSGRATPDFFEIDYNGATYPTAPGTFDTGIALQTREYQIQFKNHECNPIPNARVNLRRSNGRYVTRANTDANGYAVFEVVPESSMRFEVNYNGGTLMTDPMPPNIDVIVSARAYRLYLLNSTGDPIENVRVNLRRSDNRHLLYTRTDTEGIASVDVLPDLPLLFEVDYNGATHRTNVTTTHELETVRTHAFDLELTDSDD